MMGDAFGRQDGQPILVADADDDVAAPVVVEVIGEGADGAENGRRVPALLELQAVAFDLAAFQQIGQADRERVALGRHVREVRLGGTAFFGHDRLPAWGTFHPLCRAAGFLASGTEASSSCACSWCWPHRSFHWRIRMGGTWTRRREGETRGDSLPRCLHFSDLRTKRVCWHSLFCNWPDCNDLHTVSLRQAKLGRGGEDVTITPWKPFVGILWVINPTR